MVSQPFIVSPLIIYTMEKFVKYNAFMDENGYVYIGKDEVANWLIDTQNKEFYDFTDRKVCSISYKNAYDEAHKDR